MSHEVESMLYVGKTPWHELGVKLENPPTTEDALRLSGLDWEVGLKDLVTRDLCELVDHRAIYRLSDGSILGVGGPGWYPVQNKESFEWFNPFIEAKEATIECAGSLRGGQRVWVLAKIARDPSVIVPGDEIHKYILLANAHDGKMAARVGFTPIRVVCQNTLSMAIGHEGSSLIKVRHTKGAKVTLEKIRELMNATDASFEATAEQYRELARRKVDPKDLEKYVKVVFQTRPKGGGGGTEGGAGEAPSSAGAGSTTAPSEERASRQLEKITELFESGRGSTLPNVRGTWWAAYNAVTEYTSHVRGRSDENRLAAQFTDGLAINKRALSTALDMASA